MTNKSTKFSDLNKELLNPHVDQDHLSLTFSATLNAHGSYETTRFVLRLSPRIHELMDRILANEFGDGPLPWEVMQAYSTYIHETIHWWQHVGSTSGLLLSLSYFSQCHSSMEALKEVLEKFGPIKSLKSWTEQVLLEEGWEAQEKLASANLAVNNAVDVRYYQFYALDPRNNIRWMVNENHFEDIGYTYSIVYGLLIGLISDTLDPDFNFLPNLDGWNKELQRLHEEEYEGFCKGSKVTLPPIGLRAIYEGQARFIQLDLLNRARNAPLSCEEWCTEGYLSGIYVEAFESFLKLTESQWPTTLFDPIVPLFLLVCDIAINPTRGFPLNMECPEHIIHDVDVGIRFAELCFTIKHKPHLKTKIEKLSREEYIEVAEELTEARGYDHPLAALQEVIRWGNSNQTVQELMEEHRTFEFKPENLNIRVFLAHYIAMCKDKFENPHLFCWPSAYMTGLHSDTDIREIWLRHLSLFSDGADRDGVYPREWPNRSKEVVKTMFDRFYGAMPVYELTEQWILCDGSFECDFSWISDNYDQTTFADWANKSFKKIYGVNLSDFNIIKPKS